MIEIFYICNNAHNSTYVWIYAKNHSKPDCPFRRIIRAKMSCNDVDQYIKDMRGQMPQIITYKEWING